METKAQSSYGASAGTVALTPIPKADGKSGPAPARAAQGQFNGREVQVGVVAPHHHRGYPGSLSMRSAATGAMGFVGSWLVHAGPSSHNASSARTWEPHASHWLSHLASAAASALLPGIYDAGAHGVRYLLERSQVRQHPDQEVQRLVQHALDAKPLTLAGLQAQVVKLQAALADRPQDLAKALPRLAQVVPTRTERGCSGCCSEGLAQYRYLVAQLNTLRNQLSPEEFDQALSDIARHLPRSPALNAAQVKELATELFRAHDQLRFPAGPAATQVHADFMLALCSAPAFQMEPQVVRDAARQMLGLDRNAYLAAQPRYPVRDQKDSKDAAARVAAGGQAVGTFLGQFDREGAVEQPTASQIDDLMVAMCGTDDRKVSPEQIRRLDIRIKDVKQDTPALAHAKARAGILLHHWVDSQRGAGTQAAQSAQSSQLAAAALEKALVRETVYEEWANAPCGEREALGHLALRNPGNQVLKRLSQEVTHTRAVVLQLQQTAPERLHTELGFAVAMALKKPTAIEKAGALLPIAFAASQRADAGFGRGALLQGLVPHTVVEQLAQDIGKEDGMSNSDKADLINRLARLSQLDSTQRTYQIIDGVLASLQTRDFNAVDARATAKSAMNARIAHSAMDTLAPASLHQPWLAQGAQPDAIIDVDDIALPKEQDFSSPAVALKAGARGERIHVQDGKKQPS